jgi:serine protease Do
LKQNDIVLEVNGEKVNDSADFARIVSEAAPGTKVNLAVWRAGARQNVTAQIGSRPAMFFGYTTGPDGVIAPLPPFPPEVLSGKAFEGLMGQTPRLGIEGESVNGQLAEFFGVKEGVLVRSVTANTPAAKAGLKAGDVILKVADIPVTTTREISGVMRVAHKTAVFTVMRNHREVTVTVEIPESRQNGFLMNFPQREVL